MRNRFAASHTKGTMKVLRFGIISTVLGLLLLAGLSGCGATGSSAGGSGQESSTVQSGSSETSGGDGAWLNGSSGGVAAGVQDEALTKQLLAEPGVLTGRIYVVNDTVACTIVAKKDADAAKVKKLAQDYLDLLKKQYPDKKANVQAVQNGKSLANLS